MSMGITWFGDFNLNFISSERPRASLFKRILLSNSTVFIMELEPNQTIYIKNINEKVKKDVLKKQLYMLFSQYGKVKQIVACKGIKLRGQVCTWILASLFRFW